MGQKVHPIGFRLGVTKTWASNWLAEKRDYVRNLHLDLQVREYLRSRLSAASVGGVDIERSTGEAHIVIHTARPGVVIGKKGEEIDILTRQVAKRLGLHKNKVHLNIKEIRKPEINASIVAEGIAKQLEKRGSYRRAMKRSVQNAMRLGIAGIKICLSGRLNGVEIARREWVREGRVPLHTMKADIDYGFREALTNYGIIGVKVWVYEGESNNSSSDSLRARR